jgi:hypothetical protein
MLAQSVQLIPRKRLQREVEHIDSDPAYLSARLRELALKTYHAVRAPVDLQPGTTSVGPKLVPCSPSRSDWTDLHRQIVQLERALHAQRLDSLASYVAALRQKVEGCSRITLLTSPSDRARP